MGTFLGRQSQHFLTDLGFDYIWFSNGFAFALAAWNVTGEVFDGQAFDVSTAARVRDAVLKDGDRIGIGKALLKYMAGGNIEGAYHEEIQRLMRFDALTGVYNKRHFEESLRLAVFTTRTSPRPLSLIVFDLDHFKRINDTHGHTAGDQVLCELAKVVNETLFPDQIFGRIGGEEFAVLWEGSKLRTAVEHAEKIRARVAGHHFSFEGNSFPITVSLGVAERPPGHEEEAERLYERADEKLYQAKAGGRNRVCS
jgi:diguanylate cyclase (GGDEF)-like protein